MVDRTKGMTSDYDNGPDYAGDLNDAAQNSQMGDKTIISKLGG
jgi:hypothetical protein